jgi:PAS domain S-box-containing protein
MTEYSNAQLASLLQNMQDGWIQAIYQKCPQPIACISKDGRFLLANDAMCELLEYSPTELYRKKYSEVTHPEDIGIETEEMARLYSHQTNQCLLFKRYISKGGNVIAVLLTAYRVTDDADIFMYYVNHVTPVKNGTERKVRELLMQTENEISGDQKVRKTIVNLVVDNWHAALTALISLAGFAFFLYQIYVTQLELLEVMRQLNQTMVNH